MAGGGGGRASSVKRLLAEASRQRLKQPVAPPTDGSVFYGFGYSATADGASAEHLCRPQDAFDMEHSARLRVAVLPLVEDKAVTAAAGVDRSRSCCFRGPAWGDVTVCATVDEWLLHGPRWVVVGQPVAGQAVAEPAGQLGRLKSLIVAFQRLQQELAGRAGSGAGSGARSEGSPVPAASEAAAEATAPNELWFVFEGELDSAASVAFIRSARKEADYPVFVIVVEGGHATHPLLSHQIACEMVAKPNREVLLRLAPDARRVSRALPSMRPLTGLNGTAAPVLPVFGGGPSQLRSRWVVITGGTSGVGYEVAKWCISEGIGNLLLLSRRTELPAEAVDRLIAESALTWGPGVFPPPNVVSLLLDVSLDDCSFVKASILQAVGDGGGGCIVGIFHCAGVVSDSIVSNCKPTDGWLTPMVAAKLSGSVNMLSLFEDVNSRHEQQPPAEQRGCERPFLLMCSSSSATLGPKGQAVYCFANKFQDAVCREFLLGYRNGCDQETAASPPRVLAVQWGGWSVGMTARHSIQPIPGEKFLSAKQGVLAMGKLIAGCGGSTRSSHCSSGEVLIMDVADWRVYWAAISKCVDGSLEPDFPLRDVFSQFAEPTTVTIADLRDLRDGGQQLLPALAAPSATSSSVVLAQAFPPLGTELSHVAWEEAGVAFLAEHTFESRPLMPGETARKRRLSCSKILLFFSENCL